MPAWLPLESNPEVLNPFLWRLGVPGDWGFADVYGLDPHTVQPALAVGDDGALGPGAAASVASRDAKRLAVDALDPSLALGGTVMIFSAILASTDRTVKSVE